MRPLQSRPPGNQLTTGRLRSPDLLIVATLVSDGCPATIPPHVPLDVFPGGVGVDILDDIEMDHIHLDTQAGITLGADASTPKATGYLISTSPCGGLPLEFWGYQKPYSDCSMFKVRVLSGTAPVYWPHPSGSAALSSI